MRVVCSSVSDFMKDLETQVGASGPDCVVQKTVRINIDKSSLEGKPIRDSVKIGVILQASAVIILSNDGEYLLQLGFDCGVDYLDASKELRGTKVAEALSVEIENFCRTLGLVTGPGMIEP